MGDEGTSGGGPVRPLRRVQKGADIWARGFALYTSSTFSRLGAFFVYSVAALINP
jgi:hypothetical protein